MKAHVVEIDAKETFHIGNDRCSVRVSMEFRWNCSCGRVGGWRDLALSARRGGEQHRAKREK